MSFASVDFPPSPLGYQRDWVWRGWQIRYSYIRAHQSSHSQPASPLIFLHGFGAALTQWNANLTPLSQFHTVYAMDMLGFGASEKAAATYKVDLWVEQLYEFWRTLIGQPVVLVGHSLGALVALVAANTHPEMVKGLVLMTLPSSREELLPASLQPIVGTIEGLIAPLIVRPLFSLVRRPSVIRFILKQIYTNPNRVTEELVNDFITPTLDQGAAQVLSRLVRARTRPDFSLNTTSLLPHLTLPILVLWGEQDQVIPLSWGRQLPPLNDHLKLVEIPDAGHCSYDEQADCVNAEILNWLTQYFSAS